MGHGQGLGGGRSGSFGELTGISILTWPQIRELVPESQAYMDLLAFERKLDQTIMRKRLDIQEALKRPIKVGESLGCSQGLEAPEGTEGSGPVRVEHQGSQCSGSSSSSVLAVCPRRGSWKHRAGF